MPKARDAAEQLHEEERSHRERLASFEEKLCSLAAKVEEAPRQLRVPITTLGPRTLELMKNIEVVIQFIDEGNYVASFFDANVNASGCNPNNAFANLVETIVSRFETLD